MMSLCCLVSREEKPREKKNYTSQTVLQLHHLLVGQGQLAARHQSVGAELHLHHRPSLFLFQQQLQFGALLLHRLAYFYYVHICAESLAPF